MRRPRIYRLPDRQSPGMSRRFLRALHRLHGSAQILGLLRYNNCAPLLRQSGLIR